MDITLLAGAALVVLSILALGIALDDREPKVPENKNLWNRGYWEGQHGIPVDTRALHNMGPNDRSEYLHGRRAGWNVRVERTIQNRLEARARERDHANTL